jgi:hypothetical protein
MPWWVWVFVLVGSNVMTALGTTWYLTARMAAVFRGF